MSLGCLLGVSGVAFGCLCGGSVLSFGMFFHVFFVLVCFLSLWFRFVICIVLLCFSLIAFASRVLQVVKRVTPDPPQGHAAAVPHECRQPFFPNGSWTVIRSGTEKPMEY